MKAARFNGPEDISIEEVEKPEIQEDSDILLKVTHTCICGSDLWPYRGESDQEPGTPIGHEPMGIVEETGDDVVSVQEGDRVIIPFSTSCGECEFCRKGLYTSCTDMAFWDEKTGGGQGQYVRVPNADGSAVTVPDEHADDEEMLERLLPLTDVMCTGHHAAVSAEVSEGDTVIVIGDGAVGLCGVLAAQRLGAERIIAMGQHDDRLQVAEQFGATHTINAEPDKAVQRALELTDGGANHVMECVGLAETLNEAAQVCRPGGNVGYVGVPHIGDDFDLEAFFRKNLTLQGGVAPVRKYIEDLMDDVLQGVLDPSPIFTMEVGIDGVPDGYQAMHDRDEIKVLVRPWE
ncbi:MAG: zinc-dependent alcohol dehydrogenase family protein [Candidatus Nanohaloarchaea archaeon]|nr:zinc-dependent alcohol dehydrogenase family protein [Candidatus Nanohaloarchaea archaeon]